MFSTRRKTFDEGIEEIQSGNLDQNRSSTSPIDQFLISPLDPEARSWIMASTLLAKWLPGTISAG
jgi:hypothetical protein